MVKETEIKELGDKIIKAICTIYDPEIPVNIYELGLIYDVEISEDRDVRIEMTLTSPNCPVAESLPVDVENIVKDKKISYIDAILEYCKDNEIDPANTRSMINKTLKEKIAYEAQNLNMLKEKVAKLPF